MKQKAVKYVFLKRCLSKTSQFPSRKRVQNFVNEIFLKGNSFISYYYFLCEERVEMPASTRFLNGMVSIFYFNLYFLYYHITSGNL